MFNELQSEPKLTSLFSGCKDSLSLMLMVSTKISMGAGDLAALMAVFSVVVVVVVAVSTTVHIFVVASEPSASTSMLSSFLSYSKLASILSKIFESFNCASWQAMRNV